MLFRIQQNSRFRSLLSIFQSKFATVNPRFDHERKISSSLLYATAKEDKRTDYRTFFSRFYSQPASAFVGRFIYFLPLHFCITFERCIEFLEMQGE